MELEYIYIILALLFATGPIICLMRLGYRNSPEYKCADVAKNPAFCRRQKLNWADSATGKQEDFTVTGYHKTGIIKHSHKTDINILDNLSAL